MYEKCESVFSVYVSIKRVCVKCACAMCVRMSTKKVYECFVCGYEKCVSYAIG